MNRSGERVEGIGGWLFLVALGVIGAPFMQLSALFSNAEGLRSIIEAWQTQSILTVLLTVELFANGVFLAWACFNAYLFFGKKSDFKNSWVGFLCLSFLFVIADLVAADLVADLPVTSTEILQPIKGLFGALIYSLYIYRSERVRNTFVHSVEGREIWKRQASTLIVGGVLSLVGVYLFAYLNPPVINEQMLQAEAQAVSVKSGGQMLDDITRLDGVEAVGMTFTYRYTLVNAAASEWDVDKMVALLRPGLLETACNGGRSWLQAGVTIQYKYAGTDGLPIATLDFTDNDCPALDEQVSENGSKISARDIATKAKSSFVSIRGYVGGELTSSGSGFVVRQDGVLVTNLHVLQSVDALQVELPSGEIYDHVFVLGVDELRDIALLQIPATGLPVLPIGDDSAIEVGDTIYTLGNPLGFEKTFTDGILSARRVTEGIEHLQISAPISPGSSGGPVLNDSGKVIGVATAFMPDGQNLNIAMPSHYVNGMLAVTGEREAFEDLVGTAAFTASETVSDRNADVAEMIEGFPQEVRAKFEEMEPWQLQTSLRGFVIGNALEEDGWEEVETDGEWGALKADEEDSFKYTLEAGEYVVFGVCDNDCTDLDLGIVVEGKEPLIDNQLNAEPAVPFDLSDRSSVIILAAMESCEAADCAYWVRLYRKL